MTQNLVITLLCAPSSHVLESAIVDAVATALPCTGLNWLAANEAVEISLNTDMENRLIRLQIAKILAGLPVDFAIQTTANRRKKALIADMDSTMIDQECIDELAAEIGVKDHVAAITAKAMNGEIEFEPALRQRVALLKGLPLSIAETVMKKRITFAKGGPTLLATMRANNARCALVSGGFTLFTDKVATALGFDEHRANILQHSQNKLTGLVEEPILGSEAKVQALREIAAKQNLQEADFIAVGDGANDLPMLMAAGTGVALHAKPTVAARANIAIQHGDLTSLLYLQGYRKDEFITP